MLEFVEEALDEVALLVEQFIEGALLLAIGPRLDDRLGAFLNDGVVEVLGVVGGVGDDRSWSEAFDELGRPQDFALLTWTTDQARRISQRVGGGVDLGAQAAAGAAQPLGIRPPFFLRAPAACWWARTTVASTLTRSTSTLALKALKIPVNTSRSTQS